MSAPLDPRDDVLLVRAVELLCEPVALAPDFEQRVMARIRANEPPRRSIFAWWTQRRAITIRVRPAWVLAAAGLGALVLVGTLGKGDEIETGSNGVVVTFVAPFPNAKTVAVAGSFSSWQPIPLERQTRNGSFRLSLSIEAGVHEYMFVVDGERWVPDPLADSYVDDGFGRRNSLIHAGQSGT